MKGFEIKTRCILVLIFYCQGGAISEGDALRMTKISRTNLTPNTPLIRLSNLVLDQPTFLRYTL